MPYEVIEDLPAIIRRRLPKKAQEIFLKVWNNGYYEMGYPELTCFATAWTAVKNAGYAKNPKTGKWQKTGR